MPAIINKLSSNPHTTWAAGFYIAAKLLSGLGAIWFPAHKEQFEQTAGLIESAAIGYGLIMAGDAKPNSTP